jgi:hypothetical protein
MLKALCFYHYFQQKNYHKLGGVAIGINANKHRPLMTGAETAA